MGNLEEPCQSDNVIRLHPKVSVIVPTYNRPEMLAEALQSVVDQTFQDFEIVVVNDGGFEVEPVLAPFKRHSEIAYVRHDTNRGSAAARNTGLGIARGDYVAYLDDDDIFLHDHLETLITFLEASEYRVAYADAFRAKQERVNKSYVVTIRDVPYSSDFDYDRILLRNFIPFLCVVHEKSCLKQAGYFDETLSTLEDWDFLIRLSRRFEMCHIRKVTCEFRWRDDGSTLTSKWGDFLKNRRLLYDRYRVYSGMPRLGRWSHNRMVETALLRLTLYRLYSKRWGYREATRRLLKHLGFM